MRGSVIWSGGGRLVGGRVVGGTVIAIVIWRGGGRWVMGARRLGGSVINSVIWRGGGWQQHILVLNVFFLFIVKFLMSLVDRTLEFANNVRKITNVFSKNTFLSALIMLSLIACV